MHLAKLHSMEYHPSYDRHLEFASDRGFYRSRSPDVPRTRGLSGYNGGPFFCR
jgi:hypothetical protein